MNALQKLHEAGQSLWLDNITRPLLTSGTLRRYIDEFSLTGLTSNPTIFDHAIRHGADYDAEIRRGAKDGKSGEALFFNLALTDLRQAADLFRPVHERTHGLDGWVSLELSPLLAHDTARSIASAQQLHAEAGRPNLFIKIPGTPEGVPAIEEAIFAGVPINVTLLFSREQYLAAAEAYLRGIERRIAAGLDPPGLVGGLGLHQPLGQGRAGPGARSLARPARHRHRPAHLQGVPRPARRAALARLLNAGARPQRLLWASTGTKDPEASDVLYVQALAAPFTVSTIPEATLQAFADHGEVDNLMPADGGDCEEVLSRFQQAGIDLDALAVQLQREGAEAFDKSWNDLLECIASKSEELKKAG
jgi:transaldolase